MSKLENLLSDPISRELLRQVPVRQHQALYQQINEIGGMDDPRQLKAFQNKLQADFSEKPVDAGSSQLFGLMSAAVNARLSDLGGINFSLDANANLARLEQADLSDQQWDAVIDAQLQELRDQEGYASTSIDNSAKIANLEKIRNLHHENRKWEQDGKNPLTRPQLNRTGEIVLGDPDAQVETDNTAADAPAESGGDTYLVFND